MIQEEHERGRPYRDFAVLVRVNHDADQYLRALNMRGIPWTFSGNAGSLRPSRGAAAHRVPAIGGPPGRLGEPALPGLLRRLPGADRRSHQVRDLRRPQAPLALRRAARGAGGGRDHRGGRGRGGPARGGPAALHGAGPRAPDRRGPLSVPGRLGAHDPLREGPRRARAGGAERQQVLHAGEGRGAGAQVRQRARVREPPGRADRRGRRSRGGRGGHRDPGGARAHRAQGQGARVADRVHGGLHAEPVPVHPRSDPVEMPRRADQGHPAHRRLPRAGGAPPVLRGHDPRQGAALPHERGGSRRQAQVEGEPVRAGGARPAQGRGAALPGPGHRAAPAPGPAPGGGRPRPRPDRGRRAARDQPPAGGRLRDLPAQVPVHPHPAHPAPAAPLGRLRQRAPQRGRVLPAPSRGRQLHLARGLPRARSTTRGGTRAFSPASTRSSASGRGWPR